MTGRDRPDIELTATLRAKELRFDEAPETEVRFSGEPDHRSTSKSERRNLPDKVQPGTTYRDVEVRYRLASSVVAAREGRAEDERREE